MKRYIEYLGLFFHLYTNHDKRTAGKFPPLLYPAHFYCVNNLFCSQHFRIDERMDTKSVEKLLMLGQEILIIINSGNGFLCTKIISKHAGCHISAFIRSYCYKQVCAGYSRFFKSIYGSRRVVYCHHIQITAHFSQSFLIFVYQDNVLIFPGK